MGPGQTALTRMPSTTCSIARPRLKPATAALVVSYWRLLPPATMERTEAMLTMLPPTGLAHRWNGSFGAEDIAQEVDAQDGVPALGGSLDHGVIHAYPSVIHQNVELAKVVHGALYERGDFGFLLHVRFDEHDVAATGRNLGGDALTTLDITICKG